MHNFWKQNWWTIALQQICLTIPILLWHQQLARAGKSWNQLWRSRVRLPQCHSLFSPTRFRSRVPHPGLASEHNTRILWRANGKQQSKKVPMWVLDHLDLHSAAWVLGIHKFRKAQLSCFYRLLWKSWQHGLTLHTYLLHLFLPCDRALVTI